MQVFCLDIGGTETRGALFAEDGALKARARGAGGALSLGAPQAEQAIRAVWAAICAELALGPDAAGKTRLCAGIAGHSLTEREEALAASLDDFESCQFVGDGYTALLAATAGQPGALISVGTGVTAQRLLPVGQTLALSGWGFPAGDLGGGAWLGLKLTGLLTKYLDGVPLDPPLPRTLCNDVMAIAGKTTKEIQAWQSTARPAQYGALARPIVAHAAADDPFCRGLLQMAAGEIIDLAEALYKDKPGIVVLAGGLGAVLMPLCKAAAPGFDWQINTADPLVGAFLLASGQAPDEKLIMRPGFAASD